MSRWRADHRVRCSDRHDRRCRRTLIVVSAMKMETALTAPFEGVVTALAFRDNRRHCAGQVLATIDPMHRAKRGRRHANMATTPGRPCLLTCEALQDLAHSRFAPDSKDPGVVRQRSRGKLTCRERSICFWTREAFARSAAWRVSSATTKTDELPTSRLPTMSVVGARSKDELHRVRRRFYLAGWSRRRRDRRKEPSSRPIVRGVSMPLYSPA